MTIFLLVILIAVALGIVGAVVKGLGLLLVLGIVLLVVDVALGVLRWSHRAGRRPIR
ncbi:hypothetical protein [Streptomyces sp. NBC_01304]|uniref:hypothetical protein n=1 Tax=Streptomyces sp. NBC_01304 TaxID=2903818 RepID=UPI002E1585A8|nr:hypothetical protein OG430_03240 [Streptomyces sp. NBC_01304]